MRIFRLERSDTTARVLPLHEPAALVGKGKYAQEFVLERRPAHLNTLLKYSVYSHTANVNRRGATVADFDHVLANACLRRITPEQFISNAMAYVATDRHEYARELLLLGLPPVIVAQRVGMTARGGETPISVARDVSERTTTRRAPLVGNVSTFVRRRR